MLCSGLACTVGTSPTRYGFALDFGRRSRALGGVANLERQRCAIIIGATMSHRRRSGTNRCRPQRFRPSSVLTRWRSSRVSPNRPRPRPSPAPTIGRVLPCRLSCVSRNRTEGGGCRSPPAAPRQDPRRTAAARTDVQASRSEIDNGNDRVAGLRCPSRHPTHGPPFAFSE